MKKAPTWGKAIGILMIILGSLGVFFQLVKTILPSYMRIMPTMLDQSYRQVQDMDPLQAQNVEFLKRQWEVTDGATNAVLAMGIIGTLFLIVYIVGGAKLLAPKAFNFHFAKYTLFLLIAFNAISGYYLFFMNQNPILKGLGVYVLIGLLIDVVFLIIAFTSNKSAYGIGAVPEMDGYSLNPESDEII